MVKKVKDAIKAIKQDGWYLYSQKGSHKQYKHPTKKGRVTIPDHGKNHDLKPKVYKSIMKQAGLK